ncbi:DUF2924 domain-containing protein [Methylibium sp. Root1272]|uniref:DUF2924 domain-containing protein n=1 Tax=Methylibium sp. Root1272 TaxID=1736441 RepID=UPI0009ECABB1|nr:DUF2924 domain-containing protein [Methylibium sp. Root1272]
MSPVDAELDALVQLDRAALAERWVRAFGCPPPRSSRSQLLVLALAWQLQMAQLLGTGSPDRLLRSLRRSSVSSSGPVLAPGTRLLREWQGRTHQVTVLASGFEWNGVRYRSLSAIARAITGTAWSGPLFFGLRR